MSIMKNEDTSFRKWSNSDLIDKLNLLRSKTYVNWLSQWGVSIGINKIKSELERRNHCVSDTTNTPR